MEYKEYLKTEYWANRKKEFKKKTWNRCFICRIKNTELHVHHKRYRRNGVSILFKEKHTDFRLLCKTCHYKLHEKKLEHMLLDGTKRRYLKTRIKGE